MIVPEIGVDRAAWTVFYNSKVAKFGNFKNVLRRWQRYMEEEQRKRFRMNALGGTYDEVTWKYFAESTLQRGYRRKKGKIKPGDPILRDTDALYNSFRGGEFKLGNNSISFRISSPKYAAVHQNGAPSKNLPARPILHISKRNAKYLEQLVKKQISDRGKNGKP